MSNDPRPAERTGRQHETTFTPNGAEELLDLVKRCRETARQAVRAVHAPAGYDAAKCRRLYEVDEAALREVSLWIYERVQRREVPSADAEVTVLAEVDR